MKKGNFSVVISAYNEEKKIEDCLSSVRDLANEIIFVDNSSTDKTVEIAKKYTSKIYTRLNNPMLNVNKNFGFTKAEGDWILSLDADERVSPELSEEIKAVIQKSNMNGYWLPRKNIIFGKWIEHSGWYPDHQLRLFRRGKGKFPEKHVHEMIEVNGETGYLKEHIIHYNYENISQFLEKLGKIYAPNEAEQLIIEGYTLDWRDAIRLPTKEFVSRFFARKGYKDGFHGLMLSLLMAFYHLVVFAYVWERQNFKEEKSNFVVEVEKEWKRGYKDILFWSVNERLKQKKNPISKILLRVKAKLG